VFYNEATKKMSFGVKTITFDDTRRDGKTKASGTTSFPNHPARVAQ